MKRKLIFLLALTISVLVFPTISSADANAEATGTSMTSPAMSCFQDNGMWRVYDHLVIAMEWCTRIDLSPPDMLVLFMDPSGIPQERCNNGGGRFEFIGSKTGFNLNVCWNKDYIIVPEPAETRVWDGKSPRICVDFDGDDVVETQYQVPTAYSFPSPNLPQSTIDLVMKQMRTRFAEWPLTIEKGECLDGNSSTIYIMSEPAEAQRIIAAGTDGYAWVNGFGSAGWNMAFVFASHLNEFGTAAVAVHEAGHLFGLNHPYGFERSIMGDGHDNTLDFSAADKAILDSWFANYKAV